MIGVNLAPDPRQNLDTEARRLVLLLQQARDEAMSTGGSIGFSAGPRHYRFWQRQAGPDDGASLWIAHVDSEVFRPRDLPDGISVSELRVNQRIADGEGQKIIFTPSGMMLPFRLELGSGTHRRAITGDGRGEIRAE
jgi:general secretion pathway protein H